MNKKNEIESIVEMQLIKIEDRVKLLWKALDLSRKNQSEQTWLSLISNFHHMQEILFKLENINREILCSVGFVNPHEGVDG